MVDANVAALQTQLNRVFPGTVAVDGIMGPVTHTQLNMFFDRTDDAFLRGVDGMLTATDSMVVDNAPIYIERIAAYADGIGAPPAVTPVPAGATPPKTPAVAQIAANGNGAGLPAPAGAGSALLSGVGPFGIPMPIVLAGVGYGVYHFFFAKKKRR